MTTPDDKATRDTRLLEDHAVEAAALMRQLGNGKRIQLLCRIAAREEATVSELAHDAGLSMPATSQHLKSLRNEGLVSARRQGVEVHYRLRDERSKRLLAVLQDMFDTPDAP